MINGKDFVQLRKKIDDFDKKRNQLIIDSRKIIKLSKLVIYSLHRGDMTSSLKFKKEMNTAYVAFKKKAGNDGRLVYAGFFKMVEQEYVEALAFYYVVTENRIPTHSELKVDAEHYLLGLFDLSGELVRKAVNSAINKDFKTVSFIRELMNGLYGEYLKFDFSNGELRRKFDSVKYSVQKVEDLAFQISVKK